MRPPPAAPAIAPVTGAPAIAPIAAPPAAPRPAPVSARQPGVSPHDARPRELTATTANASFARIDDASFSGKFSSRGGDVAEDRTYIGARVSGGKAVTS